MSPPSPTDTSSDAAAIAAEPRSFRQQVVPAPSGTGQCGDATRRQGAVWKRLEKDGRQQHSPQAERMRPQSMDAAVMTLETAGTVLRTPDPNDGRKRVLERSAAMLNKIERSRAVRRDSLARRIERHLGTAERRILARPLDPLGGIADE